MTLRSSSRYVVAAVVVAAVLVGLVLSRRGRARTTLRIATGQKGGTFLPLGEALASAFVSDVKNVHATAIESPGSNASVAMLERGDVELALVSSNSHPGNRVNLIAPLYGEQLQIVVRKAANINHPADLAGKQISIGPVGSGTETIALQVLKHFGLESDKVHASNLTPLEAADRLEAGTLDAVFFVFGLRAPVISRVLNRPDMDLLSLGDPDRRGSALDGIGIDAPYLLPSVIPERAYGSLPKQPVGTVGVKALLVVRRDLDDDLVYDLSASLFGAKVRLVEKERLLARMTETFDATGSPFPVHPGADRYFRRDDPSIFSKYTDQISLAITLGALLWSGFAALRAWRRNAQKGRIESYFAKLAELTMAVRHARSPEARAVALGELDALEAEALKELAAERLEAGPAFRVLQEGFRAIARG